MKQKRNKIFLLTLVCSIIIISSATSTIGITVEKNQFEETNNQSTSINEKLFASTKSTNSETSLATTKLVIGTFVDASSAWPGMGYPIFCKIYVDGTYKGIAGWFRCVTCYVTRGIHTIAAYPTSFQIIAHSPMPDPREITIDADDRYMFIEIVFIV